MKGPFTQVGCTEDGQPVVAGVFRFFETHGLPLDAVFSVLRERGAIPCWVSFYCEALGAGMKHARILAKLDEAVADVYGAAFAGVVIGRLERLHP